MANHSLPTPLAQTLPTLARDGDRKAPLACPTAPSITYVIGAVGKRTAGSMPTGKTERTPTPTMDCHMGRRTKLVQADSYLP